MEITKKVCGNSMEVYSRVVGYYRPVQNWNKGKQEEFGLRKTFKMDSNTECGCNHETVTPVSENQSIFSI